MNANALILPLLAVVGVCLLLFFGIYVRLIKRKYSKTAAAILTVLFPIGYVITEWADIMDAVVELMALYKNTKPEEKKSPK